MTILATETLLREKKKKKKKKNPGQNVTPVSIEPDASAAMSLCSPAELSMHVLLGWSKRCLYGHAPLVQN